MTNKMLLVLLLFVMAVVAGEPRKQKLRSHADSITGSLKHAKEQEKHIEDTPKKEGGGDDDGKGKPKSMIHTTVVHVQKNGSSRVWTSTTKLGEGPGAVAQYGVEQPGRVGSLSAGSWVSKGGNAMWGQGAVRGVPSPQYAFRGLAHPGQAPRRLGPPRRSLGYTGIMYIFMPAAMYAHSNQRRIDHKRSLHLGQKGMHGGGSQGSVPSPSTKDIFRKKFNATNI